MVLGGHTSSRGSENRAGFRAPVAALGKVCSRANKAGNYVVRFSPPRSCMRRIFLPSVGPQYHNQWHRDTVL